MGRVFNPRLSSARAANGSLVLRRCRNPETLSSKTGFAHNHQAMLRLFVLALLFLPFAVSRSSLFAPRRLALPRRCSSDASRDARVRHTSHASVRLVLEIPVLSGFGGGRGTLAVHKNVAKTQESTAQTLPLRDSRARSTTRHPVSVTRFGHFKNNPRGLGA